MKRCSCCGHSDILRRYLAGTPIDICRYCLWWWWGEDEPAAETPRPPYAY